MKFQWISTFPRLKHLFWKSHNDTEPISSQLHPCSRFIVLVFSIYEYQRIQIYNMEIQDGCTRRKSSDRNAIKKWTVTMSFQLCDSALRSDCRSFPRPSGSLNDPLWLRILLIPDLQSHSSERQRNVNNGWYRKVIRRLSITPYHTFISVSLKQTYRHSAQL